MKVLSNHITIIIINLYFPDSSPKCVAFSLLAFLPQNHHLLFVKLSSFVCYSLEVSRFLSVMRLEF